MAQKSMNNWYILKLIFVMFYITKSCIFVSIKFYVFFPKMFIFVSTWISALQSCIHMGITGHLILIDIELVVQ